MKKWTSIFFILIAIIIFLVHAVVPHHHHEGLAYIDIKNNHDTNCDCNLHASDHDHDHETSEHCALKLAVFLPTSQEKYDCNFANIVHFKFDNFLSILRYTVKKSFVPKIVSTAQIPIKISFFTSFDVSSAGLRAPPLV